MGFDLGNFLSDAAKAAGDAVQTVEKIPGASDAIKSVAGSVGVDPNVVNVIADAGTKIANASPVIAAAGNLGKGNPDFSHGFAVGVGTMQTPVDKPQHLAVLRGSLSPNSQQGFDTAVALHLGKIRKPAPPLPPKARAAYHITHGMVGAPVAQKDMLMESIAIDPDARPGAVQAIKEVADSRETLWEKAMASAGFHGPSDRTNLDYKFGFGQDDDDDGGDGGDGGDGDDGGGDGDGGGGGGGNGGGGDGSPPDQPKKKKHKHHGHRPGAPRGHSGHAGHRPAAPGHHHGDPMGIGIDPFYPRGFDQEHYHRGHHHEFEPHHFVPGHPMNPFGVEPPAPFAPLMPPEHRRFEHFEHRPFEPRPFEPRPGAPHPSGHGPDAGTVAANIFDPMHIFHDQPKNVGDVLKNVFDPLHIFGDPEDPASYGWDDWHHHHDWDRRGGFRSFGPGMPPAPPMGVAPPAPPMGMPAPPMGRPAPPAPAPPAFSGPSIDYELWASYGWDGESFEMMMPEQHHEFTGMPEVPADFGKHHKKHQGRMGVEHSRVAQAFGAEGFHIGCCIAGEMQTDPQGHVALYGAQHDPRDFDYQADPIWEINAQEAVWPDVVEGFEDQQDDREEKNAMQGQMVAMEGVIP